MKPCRFPSDINHYFEVGICDVVRIITAYDSMLIDPDWNCYSDITESYEVINIYDVVTCTKDYGKEYTP